MCIIIKLKVNDEFSDVSKFQSKQGQSENCNTPQYNMCAIYHL